MDILLGVWKLARYLQTALLWTFFPWRFRRLDWKFWEGVLCFCQIWLLPGCPWSCRFWRVEGLRLKSMSVDNMCHQAFGRCLMKNPSKNSLIWPLSYWGHGPTRRWISKVFKSPLGGLDVHDSNHLWKTLRGDMILRPKLGFLRVPKPGNMATSVSTTKMTVSSWFLIGWISHPWKTLMFCFSDCDQLRLTYCFSVWTECISREIPRFCHEMKW